MGFFSWLFGRRPSEIERRLEQSYCELLQQLAMAGSSAEARDLVRSMLKRARQKSRKEGTWGLPLDYGDQLLREASSDKRLRAYLARIRTEGVTDEDIAWWWNRHDLERKMMLELDELHRMAALAKFTKDGMDAGRAAHMVRKIHPRYGDSSDDPSASAGDRSLPFELKNRIDRFIQMQTTRSPLKYREDLFGYPSFNAFVRAEIRRGAL